MSCVFLGIDDLFKYDREKVKMQMCCDKLVDVSLILDGKIKLVSNDVVLSPMTHVSDQFMIGLGRVGKMKYTASGSCFHRHIRVVFL